MPFDQLLNPPIGELLVKYASSSSLSNSLVSLLMEVIQFELEKIHEKILSYYEKYIDKKVEENCSAFNKLNLNTFPFTSYQKRVAERKKILDDYLVCTKRSLKKKINLEKEKIISILQEITEGEIFEKDLAHLLLQVIKARIAASFSALESIEIQKDSKVIENRNVNELFQDFFSMKLFLSKIEKAKKKSEVSTKQAGHLAYVLSKQFDISPKELKKEILEIPAVMIKKSIDLASYDDLTKYLTKEAENI